MLLGFLRSGVKRRFEQQFSEIGRTTSRFNHTRTLRNGDGRPCCACGTLALRTMCSADCFGTSHGSRTLAMFSLNPKHKEALSYYQSIDADQADSIMQSLRTAPPGNLSIDG